MLTLQEQIDVYSDVDKLDAAIDDDVFEKAAYYDIEEDPINLTYTVTLFDENGEILVTIKDIEDYDTAEVYLEEEFGIDELDLDDIDAQSIASTSPWGHA